VARQEEDPGVSVRQLSPRDHPLQRRLRRMRYIALVFAVLSFSLAGGWAYTWIKMNKLFASQLPPLPSLPDPQTTPVSPLLVHYRLDVPGNGEIFPALAQSAEHWPFAVLTVSNSSDKPVVQRVSAQLPGWSERAQESFELAAHESRKLFLKPALSPRAYQLGEMQQASLEVEASGADGGENFRQSRPVLLHSALDLYWGSRFANAQYIARWVTPHDDAVLHLVSAARASVPRGRLPGYNDFRNKAELRSDVRMQAQAVFRALQRSGISYVSSIFTFGNFRNMAQRVRLPRETLSTRSANCIDVSVAFASAMENLGMDPVIVVIPGHAFTGVRLAPDSDEVLYLDLTVLPNGTFAQAEQRAKRWLKETPPDQVSTVNLAAARALGIYPLPTGQVTAAVRQGD
jgi:hypothetical protein